MINYEGYKQILGNVKQMIQAEPLTEMEKDSLLSKINNFEDELDEMISGRIAELEMYVEQLESRVANSENTSIRLPWLRYGEKKSGKKLRRLAPLTIRKE